MYATHSKSSERLQYPSYNIDIFAKTIISQKLDWLKRLSPSQYRHELDRIISEKKYYDMQTIHIRIFINEHKSFVANSQLKNSYIVRLQTIRTTLNNGSGGNLFHEAICSQQ